MAASLVHVQPVCLGLLGHWECVVVWCGAAANTLWGHVA